VGWIHERRVELHPELPTDAPRAIQAFGAAGWEYIERYGANPDIFARVAVKSRTHASNNPYALFTKPLTVDQVRVFLARLKRYRDLAIVHLMLFCGLRTCEVLRLELDDVQFADARLRIRGKGNRERAMPLPEIVVLAIRQYLQLERPARCSHRRLFVILQGPRRGAPITPAGVRSLFRQRRGQLALLASAHAHRFRHTFGTDMARAGVRLPILQKMMGHADAKTTLQYIQLSLADIADEYRRAIAEIDKRYGRR
jgi:integrase